MKILLLILLLLAPVMARDVKDMKDRLSRIQKTNARMMQQDNIQVEAAPPSSPVVMAELEPAHPAANYGDRVTRLEVTLEFVRDNLADVKLQNNELQDILRDVVITLESQTKIAESNKSTTDRSELILNVILGVVGLIMTGGSGYFAWKKKGIVFKKKPAADMSATGQG